MGCSAIWCITTASSPAGATPSRDPTRGQLEWHRPNRETLQNLLHHPVYAGYYRHGHRAIDLRGGKCLVGSGIGTDPSQA